MNKMFSNVFVHNDSHKNKNKRQFIKIKQNDM